MKNYLKNRGENAWQIGSFLLILCAKISIMSLKPMRWLKKDITMQEMGYISDNPNDWSREH